MRVLRCINFGLQVYPAELKVAYHGMCYSIWKRVLIDYRDVI